VDPTVLSWRWPEPSAFITQTSIRPCRSDWKAMRSPSGEYTGLMSSHGLVVSCVSRPPSSCTVHTSAFPPRAEKKASRRPSGDQRGW